MSVVIAVCGNNFCTFVSDGRVVSMDDTSAILREDYPKIYKLNNNVLVGGTGKYLANETIITPYESIPHPKSVTLSSAKKTLGNYLSAYEKSLFRRVYFIGGKDEKGQFSLSTLHFVDDGVYEYKFMSDVPTVNQFAVKGAFPDGINQEEILQEYIYSKLPSLHTHDELCEQLKAAVNAVSKLSNTVGGKTFIESIF